MAYKVIGNDKGLISIVCDLKSDIAKLPTNASHKVSAGSDCICLEDSSVYILSNADEWTVFGGDE